MPEMGDYSGPLHFSQAVANLDDTFDMDTSYPSDEAEAEAVEQRFKVAAVRASLAQVAALVMLTEAVCTATGTDHPELDAWRAGMPLAGTPADDAEASEPPPERLAEDWAGLLSQAGEFGPEEKVQLLKAMGFIRRGNVHDRGCTSLQGSGLICTCVQPETSWGNPEDVVAFLGETYEERKKATRERIRREDEFDAARWEARYPEKG